MIFLGSYSEQALLTGQAAIQAPHVKQCLISSFPGTLAISNLNAGSRSLVLIIKIKDPFAIETFAKRPLLPDFSVRLKF